MRTFASPEFPLSQLKNNLPTPSELGSIKGKEPTLLPKAMVGHIRILLLVLANQIPAGRFLSGINYLVRSMADDVELINVPYKTTLETFTVRLKVQNN